MRVQIITNLTLIIFLLLLLIYLFIYLGDRKQELIGKGVEPASLEHAFNRLRDAGAESDQGAEWVSSIWFAEDECGVETCVRIKDTGTVSAWEKKNGTK